MLTRNDLKYMKGKNFETVRKVREYIKNNHLVSLSEIKEGTDIFGGKSVRVGSVILYLDRKNGTFQVDEVVEGSEKRA